MNKLRKIAIDGGLSGTGVRDIYGGGYIEPEELGLSECLRNEVFQWLEAY